MNTPDRPPVQPAAFVGVLGSFAIGFALAPGRSWMRALLGLAVVVSAYSVQILEPSRRMQQDFSAVAALLVGLGLAISSPDMRTSVICFVLMVAAELASDFLPIWKRRSGLRLLLQTAATSLIPLAYGYASGGGRPVWWIAVVAVAMAAVSWSLGAIAEDRRGMRHFYKQYGPKATGRVSLGVAGLGYFGILATLATLSPNPWFTLGLIIVAAFAGADIGQRRWLLRPVTTAQLAVMARRCQAFAAAFEIALSLCLLLLVRL